LAAGCGQVLSVLVGFGLHLLFKCPKQEWTVNYPSNKIKIKIKKSKESALFPKFFLFLTFVMIKTISTIHSVVVIVVSWVGWFGKIKIK